jgi:hypothetical protein
VLYSSEVCTSPISRIGAGGWRVMLDLGLRCEGKVTRVSAALRNYSVLGFCGEKAPGEEIARFQA